MQATRKTLKIAHSVASAGLIGGLGCAMVLLSVGETASVAGYAELRASLAAISKWVLIPSMGLAVVSGLFAMVVHQPFTQMGWAWAKAALGILMFKGVLHVDGLVADHAAAVSRRIAEGAAEAAVLREAVGHEWGMLWVVMALSVANVVLGVWRPRKRAARAAA